MYFLKLKALQPVDVFKFPSYSVIKYVGKLSSQYMCLNLRHKLVKWSGVILTVSGVHSCFILYMKSFSFSSLNPCRHLNAAEHILYVDNSAASAVRCHYARPSTVFTFIKSHANDTRVTTHTSTHIKLVSYNLVFCLFM